MRLPIKILFFLFLLPGLCFGASDITLNKDFTLAHPIDEKQITALNLFLDKIAISNNSGNVVDIELKSKVDSFQVDSSTTGSQSVTGVGFTPTLLILMGTDDTTAETFFGFTTGVGNDKTLYLYGAATWDTDDKLYTNSDGTNSQSATLTSFDSDGFTITKTKSNSPSGTLDIIYFAIALAT